MDIRALSSALASTGGSAAALDAATSIPADSRALVTTISISTAMTDTQKTALVQAVSMADSGALSEIQRQAAMTSIEGLGLYFSSTVSDGFPRWEVMTGLRVYGLNISASTAAASTTTPAQIQQHLDTVARATAGVSLEQAHAVVRQQVAASVPDTPAVQVDVQAPVVAAAAAPAAPTPTPAKAPAKAVTPAVGHVVTKVV